MASASPTTRAACLALGLVALGCGPAARSVTAVDLASGETRTFAAGDELPAGWAPCADPACSALPAGIPCQNLSPAVCALSPACEVRPLPCSNAGPCGEACVAAAVVLCEQLTEQADCVARRECVWDAADCPTTPCAPGAPCAAGCALPGACRATTLPQCGSLDSARCAERPDCRWAPGPCAAASCSASGCTAEACAPFCQTVAAPASCPGVSPPSPALCPEGQVVPEYSGSCVIGFTCQVSTSCPAAPTPAPEACPGGLLVPQRNAQGCLVGYECRSNASCTELAAKYAQLVDSAKACEPTASGQCQLQVSDSLACGCPTQVNAPSAQPFDDVRTAWEQLGCDQELACPMSPCAEAVSPGCTTLSSAGAGRCAG